MSRFADIATLRKLSHSVNENGTVVSTHEDTEVFCNRYSVSLENRIAGASEGLRGVVEIKMRTCDYDGQEEVLFDGIVYTVRDAYNEGDYTRIYMVRRVGNE